MSTHRGQLGWCWFGVATVVIAGMVLTQAVDLRSTTERIVAVDCRSWLAWSEPGPAEIRGSFAITPCAAWWAVIIGGLCGWIGWKAHRNGATLPFGWQGMFIWIALWGLLTAETLPLAWLFLSLLTWLAIVWLVRQRDLKSDEDDWRPFLASQVAADVCSLAGVLVAAGAWGTFDLAAFHDPDFVHAGWRQNPLACSAAGAWLWLGFACRCGWFPWLPATRIALTVSPWHAALMFGGILLPAVGWWWFSMSPILGCAPEVVAFAQGAGLLAAMIAAFVATAQTDGRRTVMLLASMQFALITSVAVLTGLLSPLELAVVIIALCLMTTLMLTSPHGWLGRLGWWLLAGGCASPLFWTAAISVERFAEFSPPGVDAGIIPEEVDATDEIYRVRPMPAATWIGAWCLMSFFAAFAARRAAATGAESERDGISVSLAMLLAVLAAWLALDEIIAGELWPGLLATISSLAGWSLASSLCQAMDGQGTEEIEAHFCRWGLWAACSQRSSFLDDGAPAAIRRKVSQWSAAVRQTEDVALPALISGGLGGIAAWLSAAVEELRSEPPGVYAVAFVLVVGSMIATWMWLVHSL